MAGLKISQSTQKSFFDGSTILLKAKRIGAIAAFNFNDFVDKLLLPSYAPRLYGKSQMAADLLAAEKLAVATIFGTASWFSFSALQCRWSRDANPDLDNASLPTICKRISRTIIAQRVNQMLAMGAKFVFSIDGTSTRFNMSSPLEGTDIGNMVVSHVDDSLCLRMANDPQNVLQTGDHSMLSRIVVYNSFDSAIFHTSLIENTGASKTVLNIDVPGRVKMRGD